MSKRKRVFLEPVTPLPPRRPDVFNILPVLFLCTGGIFCGWVSNPEMTDFVRHSSQATFCWIVAPPLLGVSLAGGYVFTVAEHWSTTTRRQKATAIILIVVAVMALLWSVFWIGLSLIQLPMGD